MRHSEQVSAISDCLVLNVMATDFSRLCHFPSSVTSFKYDSSGEISARRTRGFVCLQAEDFFKKYPQAGAAKNKRKSAMATIKRNIAWKTKHIPTIVEWLRLNSH